MLNKLLKIRFHIIYSLMWAMIIIVHFYILRNSAGLNAIQAWSDSFVFNSVFAIIGAGLWYMVRYSDLHKKSIRELAFSHLTSATVVMILWIGASYLILQALFADNKSYLVLLDSSLSIRVISGVLYYLTLVTIFYLIINYRELAEQKEKEARLTTLLREAELNLLRSQIKPHFLFNCLNSISSLTITDPEKAQEMVIKLSEFMRYSLDSPDGTLSTFARELQHAENYLGIEKIRFGKRLDFIKEIPEGFENWKIPAMILQPLIENAVKYGVYESIDVKKIFIQARPEEKHLMIVVGNHFDPDSMTRKGTGTGLKNISQRLENIYHRGDLLSISKSSNYFEVTLKIPSSDE